jgi:gliding motility-associated-like protein
VPEIEQIEYRNGSINVIAKGGEPGYEYSFDNGKTWTSNSEFSGEPNIYKVLVRNAKGQCESARMDVPVLGFSNIITPNGDGINDQFSIIGLETFTNINLSIYDRYGVMVYQNQADSDKKISWDGRYQGRTLATSTYWYTLEFTDPLTGQVYNFNSYITIKNRD